MAPGAPPRPLPTSTASFGERVLVRQAELEHDIEDLEAGGMEYVAIDTTLATIEGYLGADLNHLSAATARDLSTWLERNKYLGLTNRRATAH